VRTIIRYSVDDDMNGQTTNRLRKALEDNGMLFTPATATYEGHRTEAELGRVVAAFWRAAARAATSGPGRLDHFWMYSDGSPN